jgi:hypothetical protein
MIVVRSLMLVVDGTAGDGCAGVNKLATDQWVIIVAEV